MKKFLSLVLASLVVVALVVAGVTAGRHSRSATGTPGESAKATENVSAVPDCSNFADSADPAESDSNTASSESGAGASTLSSTDAKFCDEQRALADSTRMHTRAENDVTRTGSAQAGPVSHLRTPGWAGEVRFGPQNDWEPDVAADPSSNYVYAITTEFGNKACNQCPNPAFVLRVSNDNGQSWGPPSYVCKCKGDVPGGRWQYDPTIAVDSSGKVYVTILARWHSYLTTSTDHGQTWSDLVDVAPHFSWTDHEQISISPDGQDVYIAFNHADSYVVASHDGGQSFADPVKTNYGDSYYWYHYKGTVLSDGTVVVPSAAVSRKPYDTNLTRYYALVSSNGGVSWQTVLVAPAVPEQPDCYTQGCRHDHWGGLARLASDGNGDVAYAFVGPQVPSDGQVDFVVTSGDEGQTWSSPQPLSPSYARNGVRRVVAVFPQITGVGASGFNTWWMDDRKGHGWFNVWSRSSADGGSTWGNPDRISDATSGAPYKSSKGFMGDYGDYGGIATMSNGKVISIWGEAFGYAGPGNTWINYQT